MNIKCAVGKDFKKVVAGKPVGLDEVVTDETRRVKAWSECIICV